jgi:hypothetical protein
MEDAVLIQKTYVTRSVCAMLRPVDLVQIASKEVYAMQKDGRNEKDGDVLFVEGFSHAKATSSRRAVDDLPRLSARQRADLASRAFLEKVAEGRRRHR